MSGKNATGLVIGGEPRIDFLPPEVKAAKRARQARRSLAAVVILVLVACAGGYVFASSLAVQSQVALELEQTRTQSLLQEQSQYAEARTIARQVETARDARVVGTANEILWDAYLAELAATLPPDMTIATVTVDSISATEAVPILGGPLQRDRMATLTVTAIAPGLSTIATWMDSLRELHGFADVWASPTQLVEAGYQVDIELHINAEALEKRYFEGPTSDDDIAASDEEEGRTSSEPEGTSTEGED